MVSERRVGKAATRRAPAPRGAAPEECARTGALRHLRLHAAAADVSYHKVSGLKQHTFIRYRSGVRNPKPVSRGGDPGVGLAALSPDTRENLPFSAAFPASPDSRGHTWSYISHTHSSCPTSSHRPARALFWKSQSPSLPCSLWATVTAFLSHSSTSVLSPSTSEALPHPWLQNVT